MTRLTHIGSRRRHGFTLLSGPPTVEERREHEGKPPLHSPPAPNPWQNIPTRGQLTHRELQGTFVPEIPGSALIAAGLPASLASPRPAGTVAGLSNPTSPNALLDLISPAGGQQQLNPLEQLLSQGAAAPTAAPTATTASKPPAASLATHTDAPFTKAELHPYEKNVGENEISAPAPQWGARDYKRISSLLDQADQAKAAGKPRVQANRVERAERIDHRDVFGDPQGPHATNAVIAPDPLGKKTLGNVTYPQLLAARRAGTLRTNAKGILTTPENRQVLHELIQARHAAASQLPRVRPGGGQHTPKEYAALLEEESHKLGVKLTPAEIAEGVGVVFAESGGEASEQRQLAELSPAAAHVGPYAEEEAGFGTLQERLDPRKATNLAIQRFVADGRSWGPAWVHWQEIQGENETGHDRAAQYLPIAQQVAGATRDPQAVQALQVAKQNAKAVGINPTPFNGDVAGGGQEYTWVRADAKGMLDWASSALGITDSSPRTQKLGERFGLNTVTQPWCANFVANGLLRRGFSEAELPANPNFSGDEGTGFEAWAKQGKYATNIGTDLSKAKPGDLLAFSAQHIGIYAGNGEMISGNFGDEVRQGPISEESAPLSMIIRPKYKGGKVKVADSQLAGSSAASALGGVGGEATAAGGGEAVGSNAAVLAPEVSPLQLPGYAATPTFANTEAGPPGEDAAEMLRLLTQPGLGRGRG